MFEHVGRGGCTNVGDFGTVFLSEQTRVPGDPAVLNQPRGFFQVFSGQSVGPQGVPDVNVVVIHRRNFKGLAAGVTSQVVLVWLRMRGQPGAAFGEHDEGVEEALAVFGGGG